MLEDNFRINVDIIINEVGGIEMYKSLMRPMCFTLIPQRNSNIADDNNNMSLIPLTSAMVVMNG